MLVGWTVLNWDRRAVIFCWGGIRLSVWVT